VENEAPRKCIFFMWLVILGHWTFECCHRHDSADYALCNKHPELLDHLLLGCSFAREVWCTTLTRCGWVDHVADSIATWWLCVRKQITKSRCKAFDLLVICVSWCVWRERNDRVVFRGSVTSATGVGCVVWETLRLWCQVGLVFRLMLLVE
jgi:hypothetical protein